MLITTTIKSTTVRILATFCVMILCTSCTKYTYYYKQTKQEQTTQVIQKQALLPFNSMVINGKAKVLIVYDKNPTAFLAGQKQYIVDVHISVVDHTLYIYAPDSKRTSITVHTNNIINNITLKDNAILTTDNITGNNLILKNYDNATCTLNGEYTVNKIKQNSSQKIEIKWAHGNNINVESNTKGPIYLAGSVDNLQVFASNKAKVDAHYLKAQNAKIFTKDKAIVNVYSENYLQAFADDKSLIAYFVRPSILSKVTQKQANALYFSGSKY